MNITKTTSGAPKLTGIHGVRAFAMLMVFAFHVWDLNRYAKFVIGNFMLSDIIGRVSLGVNLFIALSGFCLYWPIANVNKPFDVKQGFQSRF